MGVYHDELGEFGIALDWLSGTRQRHGSPLTCEGGRRLGFDLPSIF